MNRSTGNVPGNAPGARVVAAAEMAEMYRRDQGSTPSLLKAMLGFTGSISLVYAAAFLLSAL